MLCNICIMQLVFFSSLLSHRTYPKWISSVIHLWSFSFKQLKLGCLAASIHLGQLVTATERERERDKISGNRWASYHLPWGLDSFRNLKRLRSLVMAGVFFERVWRRAQKGVENLTVCPSVRPSVCVALRTQYLSRVGFASRRQWHHLAAVGAAMKTAK